ESRAMLRSLSGREHTVHTGVCLLCPALGIDESHDVTAWVRFRDLAEDDITRYQSLVDTLDKAGAYGIQQGKEIIIADFRWVSSIESPHEGLVAPSADRGTCAGSRRQWRCRDLGHDWR
ncbi:Maf family protein, partial [bacterium]|nr:Maf family protein [bacterium]